MIRALSGRQCNCDDAVYTGERLYGRGIAIHSGVSVNQIDMLSHAQ